MLTEDHTPHSDPPTKKRRARTATPSQRLLTGAQVEKEFGIPYRSLYDLYVSGKLPAVRFVDGGRIWFRRSDVDALIDRSLEKQTA